MQIIRIAICDDDEREQECIKKATEAAFVEYGYRYIIEKFSINDLIKWKQERMKLYHVFWIDINSNRTAIEVAKHIRTMNENAALVCISAKIEHAIDGYRVAATRFMLKEKFEELLPECIKTICERMEQIAHVKKIHFVEGDKLIAVHQIKYIENRSHRQSFYMDYKADTVLHTYWNMDDIETELKKFGFIRIHKSYIVNIRKIYKVEKYCVWLSTGEKLSVPRDKYRDVQKNILEQLD